MMFLHKIPQKEGHLCSHWSELATSGYGRELKSGVVFREVMNNVHTILNWLGVWEVAWFQLLQSATTFIFERANMQVTFELCRSSLRFRLAWVKIGQLIVSNPAILGCRNRSLPLAR